MLSGRLEVFGFLFLFSVLFITFRLFFYAVAEPVWMVSGFRSMKKKGLAHVKIFAGNTLARRERGRFFAKPPRGLILQGRAARKYLRF
jgi:hypothetical protein